MATSHSKADASTQALAHHPQGRRGGIEAHQSPSSFGAGRASSNAEGGQKGLQRTKGFRVVVELPQRTQGVLMLGELHKAQAARPASTASLPLGVLPQQLDLLDLGACLAGTLFDLHRVRLASAGVTVHSSLNGLALKCGLLANS